jgi:hypothetical protein
MQTRAATSLQNRAVSNAGFNLIEAAIVLGIVGLIVGGIWAAAGSAYENMRLQNASKSLLSLVQGVRSAFANSPSGVVDVNVGTLANMGVIPSDMLSVVNGTPTIIHQWSGTVTTDAPDASTTGGVPAFTLIYNAVKLDSCNNLATRVANTARGSGLLLITTQNGGNPYLNLINNSAAEPAAGGPQCTAMDNVEFTFGIRG